MGLGERLGGGHRAVSVTAAAHILAAIDRALAAEARRPLVIGLCGAQGSGKSTAAAAVAAGLEAHGIAAAVLSLDDVYATAADRAALARTVHPLLHTRGVPGTHDLALAHATLDALAAGQPVRLPRFDKARDDRTPEALWPLAPPGVQVVLFEGWCVGARPQPAAALAHPVNALEAECDAEGVWRAHVNAQLAGPYAALFARLDRLFLLQAPGFEVVCGWRAEQEQALRRAAPPGAAMGMDDAAIARFVQHYERITRHILAEMPARADLVLSLDGARTVIGVVAC